MVDSKEQFVRKMSDIRTRSLVESENIAADQVLESSRVKASTLRRSLHSSRRGDSTKQEHSWMTCCNATITCASRSSSKCGWCSCIALRRLATPMI